MSPCWRNRFIDEILATIRNGQPCCVAMHFGQHGCRLTYLDLTEAG